MILSALIYRSCFRDLSSTSTSKNDEKDPVVFPNKLPISHVSSCQIKITLGALTIKNEGKKDGNNATILLRSPQGHTHVQHTYSS